MIRKAIIIFVIYILGLMPGFSQEFLGNIQIQTQGVEGIDPSVFSNMETSIFEFMNNRVWSSYTYKIEERIEFTMVITVSEVRGSDYFGGTINLVLQRPIFGTDYNSVVINLIDNDIRFEFIPHQPMDFIEGSYTNNLTSILAYYAYIMLGLDFDTYSLEGGTQFYEKAMAVVTAAQNSNEKGWQAFEGPKNRYQLVENLLNPSYNALRKLLYEYHLKGLDIMSNDIIGGRAIIGQTLKNYSTVYNKRSGLYLLQVLTEAKRPEIISIFTEASPAEKTEMINIMKEVDPANGSRYEAVNK
ncbi:MAG: DUF4835 family protein [Bacteroidetes bacterium]|nr:DUF4835 family protein [Bacteroidota bacterium]MBL6942934.1 DUF4835 family protein [Bacteroidales bacterium]